MRPSPRLMLYVQMSAPFRRLLICSLGNPGPAYSNTRHSTGHFILTQLSPHLHSSPMSLTLDRDYRAPVTHDPNYTLFQCPTQMNVSGPAVSHAWKTFSSTLTPEDKKHALLVLLHDELERNLGQVKLKVGGNSGGQNGVESVITSLGSTASKDLIKIGVGIGRPESKDSHVVAEYVLGRMTRREMQVLEEVSLGKVVRFVRMLAEEKGAPRSQSL